MRMDNKFDVSNVITKLPSWKFILHDRNFEAAQRMIDELIEFASPASPDVVWPEKKECHFNCPDEDGGYCTFCIINATIENCKVAVEG